MKRSDLIAGNQKTLSEHTKAIIAAGLTGKNHSVVMAGQIAIMAKKGETLSSLIEKVGSKLKPEAKAIFENSIKPILESSKKGLSDAVSGLKKSGGAPSIK